MSYSQIATEIVKKSIRAAICIDDEFAEPYEKAEDGINQQIPLRLYDSFRQEGNCSLDIYRYKSIQEWESSGKKLLSNKDLVILDWELESQLDKYGSTLKILDNIVSHTAIQFVIIYTHNTYLEKIATIIRSYYSAVNLKANSFRESSFEDFYEENGDSFDYLKNYIKDAIAFGDAYKHEFKLAKLLKAVGYSDTVSNFVKSAKELLSINNPEEILELLILESHNLRKHVSSFKRKCHYLDSNPLVLNVDKTIVLISQKKNDVEKDSGAGVLPEDLFSTFANAITKSPSNIMAIMASELKDIFRSNIAIIGSKIPDIDEKAFFCHWNNLRNEEGVAPEEADKQFKHFLLETWINDVSQFTLQTSKDIKYFDALTKYTEEQKSFEVDYDDIDPDLIIKLSANYSNVKIPPSQRTDHKIQFGDMFYLTSLKEKISKEILLSITPHCDSIRPQKINNTLYFVRGGLLKSKEAKKKALKDAETKHLSFVDDNGLLFGIEWITRPISVYVDLKNNNVSNLIDVSFYNNDFRLEYITTLKENYTQRVANHSFGHAMRVGVSLPKLK